MIKNYFLFRIPTFAAEILGSALLVVGHFTPKQRVILLRNIHTFIPMTTKTTARPTSPLELHDSEPRWFAVRTRAKCEKFVQRILEKKGLHVYVPLQKRMRRYERKIVWVEKPLITCYVFVYIIKEEYVPVLETENVAGFVKTGKVMSAIPQAEMDVLRRVTLEKDLDIQTIEGSLSEGDEVEISAGNLLGLRGKLVKIEGKRKMQVELENLGYSLLITVDTLFLQKVE